MFRSLLSCNLDYASTEQRTPLGVDILALGWSFLSEFKLREEDDLLVD